MEEDIAPGDSSTLIYLAKADAFGEVANCLAAILVPPAVWREAVEAGERRGAPEVTRIRSAEHAGFLRRIELDANLRQLADTIADEYRLGAGESEVLAVGATLGRGVVDEGRASRVARSLGILPISTLFLPVLGRQRRGLGEREALQLLWRLAVVTGARADVVFVIEQHIRRS
jgi:predicted nucleic acid-binding protein